MSKKGNNHRNNGALVPFEGKLPAGVTQEEFNKMVKEDLDRTMTGVIPRLPQIKILHAGALMFKFPEGGNKSHFEGIIIDHHPCNAFWEKSFQESGGGVRPDCSSLDGLRGTIHGACAVCKHNAFGSASDGSAGKACKNMKRLHILMDNEVLPFRLTLPPTSIGSADEFFTGLYSKGFPVMCKKVKFSLTPAESSAGIEYSKIRFEVIDQIDVSRYLEIRKMVEQYLPQIRGQEIMAEEYYPEEKEEETEFP